MVLKSSCNQKSPDARGSTAEIFIMSLRVPVVVGRDGRDRLEENNRFYPETKR